MVDTVDREALDEAFPSIAWDRGAAGLVPEYDFVNRYSKQHRAVLNADRTLCGSRIPWLYTASGDATRCARCDRIAAKRLAALNESQGPAA